MGELIIAVQEKNANQCVIVCLVSYVKNDSFTMKWLKKDAQSWLYNVERKITRFGFALVQTSFTLFME